MSEILIILESHLSYAGCVFALDGNGGLEKITDMSVLVQETYLQHEIDRESSSDDSTNRPSSTTKTKEYQQTQEIAVKKRDTLHRQQGDTSLYRYYLKSFNRTSLIIWAFMALLTATLEKVPSTVFLKLQFGLK